MESPYRGLLPYGDSDEDARLFFGRTVEQRILIDNLTAARLSVVYGESGVGKSSVLNAGVAYKLRADPEYLLVIYRSWFGDPVPGLIRAVETAAGLPADTLPRSSLVQALRRAIEISNRRLLIILDQFEEYFQYHPGESGDTSFAAQFPAAVLDGELDANFLISVRSDSLASLDFFKSRLPTLLRNRISLKPLTPEGAREAIEKPIGEYNKEQPPEARLTLEPGSRLADKVIQEIGRPSDEPGSSGLAEVPAPYLQLVMTRLWEREIEKNSRVVRVQTLADLGGGPRIYQEYFSTTLDRELDWSQRRLASRLFEHLTTPTGRKTTISDKELAQYPELRKKNIRPLLDKLKRASILVTVPPPPGAAEGEVFYEFAHDVLARAAKQWSAGYAGSEQYVLGLLKWGTGAAVVVMVLLALGLVREHQLTKEAQAARDSATKEAKTAREERDAALRAREEQLAAEHQLSQIRLAPQAGMLYRKKGPAMPREVVQGIDASKFTPNVDWKQVKAAGIAFAFLRATQGTTLVDNLFRQYWKQAYESGIRRGAYHVYRVNQDPAGQAKFFLATVGALAGNDLPPAVDLSTLGAPSSKLASDTLSADVLKWLQAVEAATQRKPLIFGGTRYLEDTFKGEAIRSYPVWVAQYGTQSPRPPAGWSTWTFWQFTPDGRIDGVPGSVDLNRFHGTRREFEAYR